VRGERDRDGEGADEGAVERRLAKEKEMITTDHDLLVRIDERVQKIDKCLSNHLSHHWALTLAIATALVGAVVTICITL
jgi:hypothetical protein